MSQSVTTGTTALSFSFSTQILRCIMRDGEPWFVAADVCAALEITNVTQALSRLDPDEMTLYSNEGREAGHGAQSQNLINESGLYSLILGSRKPEAKKFKKWVTSEVLPSIRKTGAYVAPTAPAQPAGEALTHNDMNNIKRMVWILAHGFRFEGVWSNGIWFYLRKVLALPSPQPYAVEHLPRIAHELHTLAQASDKVQTMLIAIEQEAARRIFRKGECADLVVADLQRQAATRLDAMQTQLAALPDYLQRDVAAITDRTRATFDHGNNEQPDYFETAKAA